MSKFESELSRVFAEAQPPNDDTGALGLLATHAHPLRVLLVLAVDEESIPIAAAFPCGQEVVTWNPSYAEFLVQSIGANRAVFPRMPIGESDLASLPGPLLGARVQAQGTNEKQAQNSGYIGIVVESIPEHFKPSDRWEEDLENAMGLAWICVTTSTASQRAHLRVNHLLAEKEMLSQSHRELVGTILVEREERIQEKREHIMELEFKVSERSEQLRAVAQEAKTAERAKSDFLANMSHEIRTPINAVQGYSELLADRDFGDPEVTEYLKIIHRNSHHLLVLIDDILDVSRIESGELMTQETPCSLRQVLNEVCSGVTKKANAKKIGFYFNFAEDLIDQATTDPTRLGQILGNLLDNAVKFTEQGSVKLDVAQERLSPETVRLKFKVTDTGIGLEPIHFEKIFKPFTQADSSMTRKYGGTGLGLTISQSLAKMLGGDITLGSELGVGSCFTATIVARVSPTAIDPSNLPKKDPKDIRLKGRVLLVDDARDNQMLLSTLLKRAGAQVEVAGNGEIALSMAVESRLEGHPFDVILMDMQMPVMDGYTATAHLRSRGFTTPIIALTGHAMKGDKKKCLDAGCDEYMTKPIRKVSFLEVVSSFMNRDQET